LVLRIDETLKQSFPGLQVLELRIGNLAIEDKRTDLELFKKHTQQRIRESFRTLDEIRDEPRFRAYRDFFWRVGIDPTKTRPAAEALTRRIVGGKDLPTINTFVDSYNLASVSTSTAIAAFDLDSISGDELSMRKARPDESFKGIGMNSEIQLEGREVVIEDEKRHNLIAIYPYRDSDDSRVTLQTKRALLMMCGVPNLPLANLEEAGRFSRELLERFCGASFLNG
jgi:DNA/RNA-binding domain of Phe-tRNA-synthetase-like protein